MRQKIQKTYATRPNDIERSWWVVDAQGMTLGRLASKVAPILRGKHKPCFTPHLDTGDYVIIINADKIHVTRQTSRPEAVLPPFRLSRRLENDDLARIDEQIPHPSAQVRH